MIKRIWWIVLATILLQSFAAFMVSAGKNSTKVTPVPAKPLPPCQGQKCSQPLTPSKFSSASFKETHSDGESFNYTVKRGDTFSSVCSRAGVESAECFRVAQSLAHSRYRLERLKEGEKLVFYTDKAKIVKMERELSPAKTLIVQRKGGTFAFRIDTAPVFESGKVATGTIHTSFSQAAKENGIPFPVIDRYVDLFGGRIEFSRDLRRGDRFIVLYTEKATQDGRVVGWGDIVAAGLRRGSKLMAVVRYKCGDGKYRFFDEEGRYAEKAFLRYPVKFTRISSIFSSARFHPVLRRRRRHNGVDFAAPVGTPVRSVADGIVRFAGYKGGAGKMVRISHGEIYATEYFHLSRIEPGIRRGVRVKRGQVIGRVGQTGLATGPHLHFGFFKKGVYVDPLKVKLPIVVEGKPFRMPQSTLKKVLDLLDKMMS
ncbi:MAG: hypothetical protein D6808_03345 [Candidatus Dadabacteria bacterium]|nr:MAG: hypothetical protein D6808_03345 [Candidatus Dadabacteria bacterium]